MPPVSTVGPTSDLTPTANQEPTATPRPCADGHTYFRPSSNVHPRAYVQCIPYSDGHAGSRSYTDSVSYAAANSCPRSRGNTWAVLRAGSLRSTDILVKPESTERSSGGT